jgi:hypothetical protein
MTALWEFYTDKKDAYAALCDDARSKFKKAVGKMADAQASYDTQLSDLADMEREAKEKRRSLAAALMSSDIEALAADLRVLLDKARNGRAGLLATEQRVATLKSDKQLAENQLKREEQNLKKANTELLASKERQKQHKSWKDTVTDGVPTALATKADALLQIIETGGAIDPDDLLAKEKEIVTKAKQRVTADIPVSLITRALARGKHLKDTDAGEANLLDGLKKEAGLYRESREGVSGKTAKFWIEFLQAEDAYRELLLQGQSCYDKALALFSSITKSTALTDAEKARITKTDLVNDGEAAAALEKDYDQARAAVDAKEFELEFAIVKARIKNLTENPELDDDVFNIRAELDDLNSTLTLTKNAYTAIHQDNLDLWEASIPDHIWANLVCYDQATTLLAAIKDSDPAALAMAMDNAEAALVTALEEQDLSIRTNNFLEDTLVKLEGQTKYSINMRQQRLLSVIRGD